MCVISLTYFLEQTKIICKVNIYNNTKPSFKWSYIRKYIPVCLSAHLPCGMREDKEKITILSIFS